MLARYALFCLGCALVQLSRLTTRRDPSRLLTAAAILSLLAEFAIGLWMFRWWAALVVFATVTVAVDVTALQVRRPALLAFGTVACLAGALSLAGMF